MSGLRRALLGLGAAALLAGLITIPLTLGSHHAYSRGLYLASQLVVGWSFAATGLVIWWRRPENRVGALMTAVGLTWLLSSLAAANDGYLLFLGQFVAALPYGFLVVMLLSFPDGRLHSRLERAVVLGTWIDVTIVQWARLAFLQFPRAPDCVGCPRNPLLVSDRFGLADALNSAQAALAVVLVGALIVALFQRRRTFAPAQRSSLGPVLWTGGTALAVLALFFAAVLGGLRNAGTSAVFHVGLVPLAAVPYAFVVGLLRSRFTRAGAVSELLARLNERSDRSATLRDALADAFGDPSLSFAYWLPEQQRYVDAAGNPVALPDDDGDRAWTPVQRNGAPLAAIIHDASLVPDRQLLATAGDAAGLALENERLAAELRARVEELHRSRERLIEVGLAERRALERNLHDGAQQRLVALALSLRLARERVDRDPDGARDLLSEALVELDTATSELRELARGIHPAVLSDRGLVAAVKALAGRAGVPVELVEAPTERLPTVIEVAAYYVVAEALTNITKYATASYVDVRIKRQDGHVTVRITDDGVGGADPRRGSGLHGLADRLAALDATLDVDSPPGRGTRLTAQIPCA